MLRIAIDMDEVIADAHQAQVDWLRANVGDDATGSPEADHGAATTAALEAYLHEGTFFGGLEPMPGAQDALQRLAQKHEVFITTAAFEYPASLPFKYAWLRKHFPFLDPLRFVFCGDKSIINADILIDDNSRHFTRFRGRGVLFDAPHNRDVKGYPRVRGWTEAEAYVASAGATVPA